MTSLFKKLSIFIKIGVIKCYGVRLVSFKTVNRIRRQSSRIVFTPPTPTRQNSFVASAVCIGLYTTPDNFGNVRILTYYKSDLYTTVYNCTIAIYLHHAAARSVLSNAKAATTQPPVSWNKKRNKEKQPQAGHRCHGSSRDKLVDTHDRPGMHNLWNVG